jgi:hypothetical protein
MRTRNRSRRMVWFVSLGLAGFIYAASGTLPGCAPIVAEPIQIPSDIGHACIPYPEREFGFSGFKEPEVNIVSRDFDQCQTGICLLNHFQGRATCPLGQAEPMPCAGPADSICPAGSACQEAGVVPVYCDATAADGGAAQCMDYGGACNGERSACECSADEHCPQGTRCDVAAKQCKKFVCHVPESCQSADASDEENAGKACCVPGSGAPVTSAVCGQCGTRPEEDAVYCSCRCGPAEGAPDEGNYCTCPDDFECKELVPDVGLGNDTAGKYCIKRGTAWDGTCGVVNGFFDATQCRGIGFP